MVDNRLQVFSEVDPLEMVLLHRPGRELANLMPSLMEDLLFDELPFLENARREHDYFASLLEKAGAQVLYLEDLCAEALQSEEVRTAFVERFLEEASIKTKMEREAARELLLSIEEPKALILKTMEGIRREEVELPPGPLYQRLESKFFVTKPMPNLYFTRDPFSILTDSVLVNRMWKETRRRETLYGDLIFHHHPKWKLSEERFLYRREEPYSIEGGDLCILSEDVLAVGISERTESLAIEALAERVLSRGFKKVLAVTIPNTRAFMHLDTVFTMVDWDLFTVHPGIEPTLRIYALKLREDQLVLDYESDSLEEVLSRELGIKPRLLRSGRGLFDASREQWSDGYNTLAVAPGEVIVYERNTATNALLEEAGVRLHLMESGELSRGRGGPRCMSMPLRRKRNKRP